MTINFEIKDLTNLKWDRTRHSSGTAGSFLKAYERINGSNYYYKLSNFNEVEGIVGHECVNEVVADRLLTYFKIDHLAYELIHAKIRVNGKEYITWLCRSKDFKKPGDKKASIETFYELEKTNDESLMEFIKRFGFYKTICNMLVIDFLILNRDRHGANVEVIGNRLDKTMHLAPLFDHGLSLMFNARTDKEFAEWDPKADKPVQCFVGSHSSLKNLDLIETKHLPALPEFDDRFKDYLLKGLEPIMGATWVEATWNFLTVRRNIYEDFCNKRRGQ